MIMDCAETLQAATPVHVPWGMSSDRTQMRAKVRGDLVLGCFCDRFHDNARQESDSACRKAITSMCSLLLPNVLFRVFNSLCLNILYWLQTFAFGLTSLFVRASMYFKSLYFIPFLLLLSV